MLFKAIVILILFVILYSLGSALYHLAKNKEDSVSVVKALTWRICLSLTLFFLLIIAYLMNWIVPHAI